VAVLGAASVCSAVVQAATVSGFTLGTYRGTTSQGEKIALKLVKLSSCGHAHGLCVVDLTQGYVSLTCPEGRMTNNYIDPFDLPVPASGKVHVVSHVSDGSRIEESIQVKRHGTITGSYKITGVPDAIDSSEVTGTCSASVTYTLHRA
jgi:hypothetical protein